MLSINAPDFCTQHNVFQHNYQNTNFRFHNVFDGIPDWSRELFFVDFNYPHWLPELVFHMCIQIWQWLKTLLFRLWYRAPLKILLHHKWLTGVRKGWGVSCLFSWRRLEADNWIRKSSVIRAHPRAKQHTVHKSNFVQRNNPVKSEFFLIIKVLKSQIYLSRDEAGVMQCLYLEDIRVDYPQTTYCDFIHVI